MDRRTVKEILFVRHGRTAISLFIFFGRDYVIFINNTDEIKPAVRTLCTRSTNRYITAIQQNCNCVVPSFRLSWSCKCTTKIASRII